MDFTALLIVGLFILFAGIAGFFISLSLRRRVGELERRLAQLQAQLPVILAQRPSASSTTEPSVELALRPTNSTPPPAPEPSPSAATSPPEPASMASPISPPPAKRVQGRDVETLLGTRWTVWIGALALALGGIFLVRYSIEQGFFGPTIRIVSAGALALVLIAAGEWLRRRESTMPPPAIRGAPIPALLTAAGTMTAFGAAFAAHALYDLIGPGLAFSALAVIAMATLVASALHGPWLAGLGLLGAMISPLLVNTPDPDHAMLAIYLVTVAAAGYGAASLRGWPQIGRATLAGVIAWGVLLAAEAPESDMALRLYLVAQTALAGFVYGYRPYHALRDADSFPVREGHLALAAMALLAMALIITTLAWTAWLAPVLILMLMALAWRIPAIAGAALLAGAVAVVTIAQWPALPEPLASGPAHPIFNAPLPDSVANFSAVTTLFALLVGAPAIARLWCGSALPWMTAALYAAAAVLTPLALLVIAWLRIRNFAVAPEFAAVAGALAAGFAALAILAARRSTAPATPSPAHGIALEAFAAGAIAALALGLVMVLERGYLTVALALAACGAAWVTMRGPVNTLRAAAGALAALVLARIIWDPGIMAGHPGTTPIVNWLLFGYGVPAVAFWMGARFLRGGPADLPLRLMEALALIFALLLVIFEIRHFFHGEDLLTARRSHLEIGLELTSIAGFALALLRLDAFDANPVYRFASLAFAVLTVPMAVLGLLLDTNPLRDGQPVLGGVVFNSLLGGYAMPALALAALAWFSRARRPRWLVGSVSAAAIALGFAYVSLQTRRLFHGPDLSLAGADIGARELWAYSAVWLALGLTMLAAGIVWRLKALRLVSAAFVIPSILKVFLIDMGGLEGFWRALSFIGLGAALIGIGLVYQRYVFAPVPATTPAAAPD